MPTIRRTAAWCRRRVRIPAYACGFVLALSLAFPTFHRADELTQLNAEIDQLNADRTRMEREFVFVSNRIAAKESLIEELVAGRRTLKDVSSEFARLQADEPAQAGADESDINARAVLGYAEHRCGSGSAKERVMNELRRQYRDKPAGEPPSGR